MLREHCKRCALAVLRERPGSVYERAMKPSRPKKAASKTATKKAAKAAPRRGAKTKPTTARATTKLKGTTKPKASAKPKLKAKATKRTSKRTAPRRAHVHSHDHVHDHDHGDHDHDHHDHDHVHAPSVRPQPLIAVRDVEASAEWYAALLGAERLGGDTHGNVYDRVLSDGQLILQLHAWDEENHPNLVGAQASKHGHGVLLWFEVDDFDDAVDRARALGAEIVEEPYVNPGPKHREIWLRDPDGYMVVVVSPDGDAAQ